jgi:F-type H+-transporting ATPase subunit epsilon
MPGQLQLRIVTPERPVFQGTVDAVVVPAHDGEIGILPRHARLLAALGVGELRATLGTKVQRFFVEGGFVQVSADRVTVLCDRAAPLADVDPRAARAEAEAAVSRRSPDAARLRQRATVLERVTRRSSAGSTAH